MESMGVKIRRRRQRLAFTLDDLSAATSISKPYLSLIETGRVPNPPSDEKLRRLEKTLSFSPGELVAQAHIQRTPSDVRAVLDQLLGRDSAAAAALHGRNAVADPTSVADLLAGHSMPPVAHLPHSSPGHARLAGLDLDAAFLSGMLQEMVEKVAGNVENVPTNSVPIINRVSAGYPEDFTDLSYPPRVADDYVGCPDVKDPHAFAARIHGDSMTPKYHQDEIVIFSPDAPVRSGDDCFVRFDDGRTTFKRAFFESDDQNNAVIRLQPRNERYRPQIIPAEKITGLYRAVYRYQPIGE